MKKQQEIRVKKQKAAKSRWEGVCENDAGADACASEMHNQTQCPSSSPSSSSSTSVNNKEVLSNESTSSGVTVQPHLDPLCFMDHWNSHESLPRIMKMTDARKRQVTVRARDPSFRDNWNLAVTLLSRSAFHTGDNDRQWRADVDWFLKNDKNYLKILERKQEINGQFRKGQSGNSEQTQGNGSQGPQSCRPSFADQESAYGDVIEV